MIVARLRRGCEEKTQPRSPAARRQSQRPVLIFFVKSGRVRPALADDIERGRVLRVRRFDPRFDRDRIAIGKIDILTFINHTSLKN